MELFAVKIEGSGRHIHITEEHLEILYGKGYKLRVKRYLSQPGEFLSEERLDVVGPKGTLAGVSILGPARGKTQVELSFTDARAAGLDVPIRESGDLVGSAAAKLVGPVGTVDLQEGVIAAKRHIHLTPEDAAKHGIADKEIVLVKVGGPRSLVFDEVVARVSPKYATAVHIDYDELNSAALSGGATGTVMKKH